MPRPRSGSGRGRKVASARQHALELVSETYDSSPRSGKLQLEFQLVALTTLVLVACGLVMVFSATSASATLGNRSAAVYLVRQAGFAALGLIALLVFYRFNYRHLRLLAPTLLVAGLGLCLTVLIIGVEVKGARRWLTLGPMALQPSELVKLGLALWIPARMARRPRPRSLGELVKPVGFMVAIACGLIAVEPDLGTIVSILVMVAAALVVAGVPLLLLFRVYVLVFLAGLAAVMNEPYQKARLLDFVHGDSYQTTQSLIGLGSGGVFGRGLGQGVQKIHYLPEAHTDMIASVIGEEIGFVGIVFLILCYAAFAWSGLRIALACRDPFGKMVAATLTTMICGQAAINLAAVFGLLPLTGITLPFVSYGGSSLVVSLIGAGILLNIAVNHGRQPEMLDRSRRNRRARAAGARRR